MFVFYNWSKTFLVMDIEVFIYCTMLLIVLLISLRLPLQSLLIIEIFNPSQLPPLLRFQCNHLISICGDQNYTSVALSKFTKLHQGLLLLCSMLMFLKAVCVFSVTPSFKKGTTGLFERNINRRKGNNPLRIFSPMFKTALAVINLTEWSVWTQDKIA